MTKENLEKIAERLEGTADSIESACECLDIEWEEDMEDKLLDCNLERCMGCGWWMECCELVDEDNDDVGYCDQCREDE